MRWTIACFVLLSMVAQRAAAAPDAVIPVSEDTFVSLAAPDSAAGGGAVELRSGGGGGDPGNRVFLRFHLPPLAGGRITSATLRGEWDGPIAAGSGPHLLHFVADDAWTSAMLTWNTQPSTSGGQLARTDLLGLESGASIALDVTVAAQREQNGDGFLSLRLAAIDDGFAGARWMAREGVGSAFRLELTLDPKPRVAGGDLVGLSSFGAVAAVSSETHLQKLVAPLPSDPVVFNALAWDPATRSIVAVDLSQALRRIEPATGAVSDAGVSVPPVWALAVDSGGHIYGTISSSFSFGPARIVAIDDATGAARDLATDFPLVDVMGIAVDASGQLVVADAGANALLGVDPASGAVTILANGNLLDVPTAVAFAPDGFLYVANNGSYPARIVRVDPATGAQADVGAVGFGPMLLAAEPGGTLLVAENSAAPEVMSYELARLDPVTGAVTELRAPYSTGDGLTGLAALDDGGTALAIWGAAGPMVRRLDATSGGESVIAAPIASVGDLAMTGGGRLLLMGGDRLHWLDLASGATQLLTDPAEMGNVPEAWSGSFQKVAIGPNGRIFAIRSGELVEVNAERGTLRTLTAPIASFEAIAVDRDGNLLAAARSGSGLATLWSVQPDSGAATIVSSGGPLSITADLAVARDGTIYASEASHAASAIYRIDRATGAQSLVAQRDAAFGVSAFGNIEVDEEGRLLAGSPDLVRIDPRTGVLEPIADGGDGTSFYSGLARRLPRCANGLDDDRDGRVDWPDDPQCTSVEDDAEASGCGLGVELAPLLLALRWLARVRGTRRSTPSR